uniref:Uncharacterized protein n=1 Tax=Anopheles atroparvus TaxID=41427 RepID=A0A182J1V7_ANOAO
MENFGVRGSLHMIDRLTAILRSPGDDAEPKRRTKIWLESPNAIQTNEKRDPGTGSFNDNRTAIELRVGETHFNLPNMFYWDCLISSRVYESHSESGEQAAQAQECSAAQTRTGDALVVVGSAHGQHRHARPDVHQDKRHSHLLCVSVNRMPLISASSSSNLASFMLTSMRKSSSNLYAPPPVAQIVVTSCAIPFDLASRRKLSISEVGKRMKCSEPRRPRITTSSICRWLSRWPVLP